jgi:hypothetical protein
LRRDEHADSKVTGGDVAAAALQRNAAAAIVNVSRVIAPRSYHFVIAVWRAKEAELPPKWTRRTPPSRAKLN